MLETTLTGRADGTYEWHVNPSGRPLFPGETYMMSCVVPGGDTSSRQVAVARGGRVTVDWATECARAVDDVICGRDGNDRIRGGAGADRLFGGPGKDRIRGGAGRDSCRGGRGKDRLRSCP